MLNVSRDLGRDRSATARRLLLVGGKGGVGKTTVAAALALQAARSGTRCLLVSTDPAHSLGDLFDRDIGDPEREILPHLWGLEVDPEAETDRYLRQVKRAMRDLARPRMYEQINRQMELARLAPGTAEAAMLDRMVEIILDGLEQYDRIVFDTAPTGHTLRLLSLAEAMRSWVEGLMTQQDRSAALRRAARRSRERSSGDELSLIDAAEEGADERLKKVREILEERQRKFSQVAELLRRTDSTGFLLVIVPEKLAIHETRKALEVLRRQRVPVVGLVVNKVLPEGSTDPFLQRRREREARYLTEIDESFRDLPRVRVPLLPTDAEGVEDLERIAGWILAEGA